MSNRQKRKLMRKIKFYTSRSLLITFLVISISVLFEGTNESTANSNVLPEVKEEVETSINMMEVKNVLQCSYRLVNDVSVLLTELYNTYDSTEENESSDTFENNETKDEEIKEEEVIKYDCSVLGYTTSNLNIRKYASIESDIISVLPMYSKIYFSYIENNDEWVVIEYNNEYAYLAKKYIKEGEVKKTNYTSKNVYGDKRKSYMDWKCITNKRSLQWKLQHQYAYTESNGVRAVNGRYCIAVGSYYTHSIGQYVDVVLENGLIIPCIIGDAKNDLHTINNHSLGLDGGAVEFVVDTKSLPSMARRMGDVSYISDKWRSKVVEIRIYDKNLFD